MAEFIKNSPFRFWCQKVLPLVYDDSLSYYELLCKVVGKLNELAENQNNLSDEIKKVATDLNDFKTQVPDMVEAKVEEWLNNYITAHGLVNSVNGMTGEVTLTAADVGAIANVNGSVKNNNIADGAVTAEKIADGAVTGEKIADKAITANKLADGVIPEKLPNPQKLTFTGAVTGEYDGSQAVNIDIPAGGGGGGGAVDSVNGMTGAVVLKKLTAGEGLNMSGEGGYNGSAEQSVEIAPGGVSGDKIADGAITRDKLANNAVTGGKIANKAVTTDKIFDGAITSDKMASGVLPKIQTYSKNIAISVGTLYLFIGQVNDIYNIYAKVLYTKSGKPTTEEYTINYPYEKIGKFDIGGYITLCNLNNGKTDAEIYFEFKESGCKVEIRWLGQFSSTGAGVSAGSATMGYTS